jgi:hypothetical protein
MTRPGNGCYLHGQELVREVQVLPPVVIVWNLGLGETEVLAWA